MINFAKKLNSNSAGFTLVEMLVSLSIFTVVVTMSVGTLLVLINANGIAQGMQLVMTNLSFTMDSLTREVRTSTDWYCGAHPGVGPTNPGPNIPIGDGSNPNATRDCSSATPGNYLSIVESGSSLTSTLTACDTQAELDNCSRRITYWYNASYYANGHGAILRKLGDDTEGGIWVPLTGADVAIDVMEFYVDHTSRYVHDNSDQRQPTATIYIKGRAGFDSGNPNDRGVRVKEFQLQTSIAQRLLDI